MKTYTIELTEDELNRLCLCLEYVDLDDYCKSCKCYAAYEDWDNLRQKFNKL